MKDCVLGGAIQRDLYCVILKSYFPLLPFHAFLIDARITFVMRRFVCSLGSREQSKIDAYGASVCHLRTEFGPQDF